LRKGLHDSNLTVRRAAVTALAELKGLLEEADISLLEALSAPDVEVRFTVLRKLLEASYESRHRFPRHVPGFQAALFRQVCESDSRVRRTAALALFALIDSSYTLAAELLESKHLDALLTGLRETLQNKDSYVRAVTVKCLGMLSERTNKAVPFLSEALIDTDRRVQLLAAQELGQLDAGAVPELLKTVQTRQGTPRLLAIAALGEIGPEAKAAIPALLDIIAEHYSSARAPAILALKKIRTPRRGSVD
jgi:HEAT repeat protein